MEIKHNDVNRVYNKWLYRDDFTIATIIVNIIDVCNYSCYYCYNRLPRTNKFLNLSKLYEFCNWFYSNVNKYINICILGGEPTLHLDLVDFCKKIDKNLKTVKCIIITNFSKSIEYFNTLLNANANLILSWHSLPNDRNNQKFIDKVNSISYQYFIDDRIKISVMYEKLFINNSLYAFDCMYDKFYKYMEFSIVENNHLHGLKSEIYKYSDDELKKFNDRISNKTYFDSLTYKHIEFEYPDRTEKKILSLTLLDTKLVNFYNYKCKAGIDQLQIYFNGDISPCDDLFEKGIILGNLYKGNFDKQKFHFRICQLHDCPCPAFSMKEKLFK